MYFFKLYIYFITLKNQPWYSLKACNIFTILYLFPIHSWIMNYYDHIHMFSDLPWWLGLGLDRHAYVFFSLQIVCFYLNHFIRIYTNVHLLKELRFLMRLGWYFWSCFDLYTDNLLSPQTIHLFLMQCQAFQVKSISSCTSMCHQFD